MKPLGKMSGVWVLAVILGLTGASCAVRATTDRRPPTASEPDVATRARVQADYGKLPLHFEPNWGQTGEQVKFLSRGSGYTLFLTPTEAVLALTGTQGRGDTETRGHGDIGTIAASPPRPRFGGEGQGEGAVLRLKLVGANPHPQVIGLDELPGRSNYFLGNDPENWVRRVA